MPNTNIPVLCAIVWLFLSGCTALPGGPHLYPRDALQQKEPIAGIVQPGNTDVFLLYVHGMGPTKNDFHAEFLARGAKYLAGGSLNRDPGFGDKSCEDAEESCRAVELPAPVYVRGEGMNCLRDPAKIDPCKITHFGELRKNIVSSKKVRIHTYAYYWDASAYLLQRRYAYTDTQLDKSEDGFRPLLNARLKTAIVTEGFSDAALYMGPFGLTMRQGLEGAICMMLKDALGRSANNQVPCMLSDLTADDHKRITSMRLSFAAKSLGSRYLFDTMLPADQLDALVFNAESRSRVFDEKKIRNTIATKKAIAANVSDVYLMANQLPLLGLGRLQIGSAARLDLRDNIYCDEIVPEIGDCSFAPLSDTAVDENAALNDHGLFGFAADARAAAGLEARVVNVYAYHDPADLLGYKAGVHFTENAKKTVRFVEIVHRNAAQWLWLAASPAAAHAGEDEHDSSAKIIWCGGTVGKNGKISAKQCD